MGRERKIIGVYPICNTGGICLHAIDDGKERVLASINGHDPEWCRIKEGPANEGSENGERELGFYLGSFFVPLNQVMKV